MKLKASDFPLIAIGPLIYSRNQSSPILTAWDDELAAEIAHRLNRDDQSYPIEEPTP